MLNYFVYILTNKNNTVPYTGVTNNLFFRVNQHKSGKGGKFTAKYKIGKLIYYEMFDNAYDALNRVRTTRIAGGLTQRPRRAWYWQHLKVLLSLRSSRVHRLPSR